MKKRSRAAKKMTPQEKEKLEISRKNAEFRKKIRNTFSGSGFTYYPTVEKHFSIGSRMVELDYLFQYENIIVICEDNTKKKKDIDHIRNKNESFIEIKTNKQTLLSWLIETFPEKAPLINRYRADRYFLYYVYISQTEVDLTDEEKLRYNNLLFWDPETLAYFNRMSQCIHYSARYELFRYLGLKNEDIGYSGSEGTKTTIKAPIIYPQDATGLRNGVRIVSFMMSAEKLLSTSYILRKDSWEESMFLYQRLIEKDKVKNIRAFLASKGEAFYNNIIVALPDNITFEDDSGRSVPVERIGDFQHCKLILPDEMNSVCIIDGQHRIFAHYEAPDTEKYEAQISILRSQLHLLVTGLIFPPAMKEAERIKIQSEIFLDINNNTKKVAPNVLTHIEMVKDPFSSIGLARRTIEQLNKKRIFLNRFELSGLDNSKIKVASIIKFALKYLVTVTPAAGKRSLYEFWRGDKAAFQEKDEAALADYISFCTSCINDFFCAVKDNYSREWDDPSSKLLSVISINGFIMTLNGLLGKYGVNDFQFYRDRLKNLSIDFSKDAFLYTSSQYKKLSRQILSEAFDFADEDLNSI